MTRVGVLGAGIMGSNHARVASTFREVEVRLVVDPHEQAGKTLAEAHGAAWAPALPDHLDIDLAIVAAPTDLHYPLGMHLIRQGIPLLIEKPLAATVGQAAELVDAAKSRSVSLAVGHVERFNPAVLELDNLGTEIVHIDCSRLSPYSPRVKEGVVRDLMIHDLDIVSHLLGPVDRIQAIARRVLSDTEDIATAIIEFESGATANLTASRVGQNKIRSLQITTVDSFVVVDLLQQAVTIHKVEHSEYLSSKGSRYRQNGLIEIPFLEQRGEPLALQFEDLLRMVTDGSAPRVSGEEGLEALKLVDRVMSAASVST